MRKLVAVVLGALLATSLLTLVVSGPAEAYTRTQLKTRAEKLNFSVSLGTFMKVYRNTKSGIDTKFDWANYDGCSVDQVPQPVKATLLGWRDNFRKSCLRHDFGYRNFGNGLALGSNATYKAKIDSRFRADMRNQCVAQFSITGDRADCYIAAEEFYAGVTRFGQAQTAFYKGECPSGSFCLFDDTSFEDRRKALTSSEDDMNDIDFGDKTSSVMNRSARAWVIYDDHDYKDRAFCIPPKGSVKNLGTDTIKFGDKTSSAKKMSGASCPSGVPVLYKN